MLVHDTRSRVTVSALSLISGVTSYIILGRVVFLCFSGWYAWAAFGFKGKDF